MIRLEKLLLLFAQVLWLLKAIKLEPVEKSHPIQRLKMNLKVIFLKSFIYFVLDYDYSEEKVCVWKNIVTSRGPGTTFDFAFKILEILSGIDKVNEVRKQVLL